MSGGLSNDLEAARRWEGSVARRRKCAKQPLPVPSPPASPLFLSILLAPFSGPGPPCPCVSHHCTHTIAHPEAQTVDPPGLLLAPHPWNRIHCVLWVLALPDSCLPASFSPQLPAGIFVQTTAISCRGLPAWLLGSGRALPSSSSKHERGPVTPAGPPPVLSSNLGEGPSPTRAREGPSLLPATSARSPLATVMLTTVLARLSGLTVPQAGPAAPPSGPGAG